MRAIVLGAGMVGSAMAEDLAADRAYEVTVADVRPDVLARRPTASGLRALTADLGDPDVVRKLVSDFDLVLGALPSSLGLKTLRAVIEARKPYVDISFMAEDGTELSGLARELGVTAVIDCGVAPGVSNMIAGWGASQLDVCERLDICVGGLPVERRWPYEYKAGFSPIDVIEEYTRPARIVEKGRLVVREALSEPELLDFAGIGTLEAFNTDGLRSLVQTLSGVPDMRERTLRYPGHIALMRVLRETGFFSKEPVPVRGLTVRPLDVTAALLFPKWTFGEGEADLTVMRVVVEGLRGKERVRISADLLDRYDPRTGLRSMSRTTAFPAAIMARMVAEGRFSRKGVFPPEIPAREPGLLDRMLAELERRGVHYTMRTEGVS
jgi:saccharopine dehydrogenase-like NADP-dependent oxidoreductase